MKSYYKLWMVIFIYGCAQKVGIMPELVPLKPKNIGVIEGLIYEIDGKTPIPGVMVIAYDRYGYPVNYSQSDIYGRYTMRNLLFGEYVLQIRSGEFYGTAQKYAGEYYKSAYDWRDAGLISITSSEPVTAINFLLEKGGTIRGRIIDMSNREPIRNNPFFLMLYSAQNLYVSYFSYTDSLGEYLITGIEPGRYKIKIEPEGWVGGFLAHLTEDRRQRTEDRGQKTEDRGQRIDFWDSIGVVESNLDTITLTDFECLGGGGISGAVILPEGNIQFPSGMVVQVIGKDKSLQKGIDSTGHYELYGLPADEYTVKLSPTKGSLYGMEYYPTKVNLSTGDTVLDIDFHPNVGGMISGTVKDEYSIPIDEFDVEVYPTTINETPLCGEGRGEPLLSGAETHYSGGKYEIGGLPEGEYILRISSFSSRNRSSYISEYYGASTPIKVNSGYNTSNIDFTLKKAGWVEGFVFLNSNLLSSNEMKFKLLAFNINTGSVNISQNTFCGGYRIYGLAPGEYKICAFSPNSEYASVWFGGGRRFDDPKTSIVKVDSWEATNVDISVTVGMCQIKGKVSEASTADIIAYDESGHIVQLSQVQKDNSYTLQGLEAGKYYIRNSNKWYKDISTPLASGSPTSGKEQYYVMHIPVQANAIEVKENEVLTGIDF
ncbi:MAG: carboxypeptidase regulatory-like domain-containing protein [Candidatus Stahlbacteria bacterium]|nr:carboxypeptidase regulatory-like domain-containing protein [Candidatus Stahlbacteria bacterium]